MHGQRTAVRNLKSMKDKGIPVSALALICLLQGCVSAPFASNSSDAQVQLALDEVRIELADVQHALKAKDTEIRLLEENLSAASGKVVRQESSPSTALLEKRISQLEKMQEKTSSSLAQYKEKIHQLEQEISSRLSELSKIRTTLGAISQAVQKPSSAAIERKKYTVKAGDSLEKIARKEHVSVDALKKLNDLDSDRIAVGQVLTLPHGE